jgi:SAM-dependent methyltransferase
MAESSTLQPLAELDRWHEQKDPWQYESTPDDANRKAILLSELPRLEYTSVLDIGCGQGFITRDLPGQQIVGVDISPAAIRQAKTYESERISFIQGSLFELPELLAGRRFDLIVITGVLYPQYIANGLSLAYLVIDQLLAESGTLVSVHIDQWYRARFPYLTIKNISYQYREFTHLLEVYVK